MAKKTGDRPERTGGRFQGRPTPPDDKTPALRHTGIDVIGDAPWGTHFCQFYQTKEDLVDILVPYFKAGLRANEFCMWITAQPLEKAEAEAALKKALPDLAKYIKKGQIEILPYDEWYTRGGVFESQRVLDGWIDKLDQARARGFDGLRLTGNTFWLEKADWQGFTDYERAVDEVIGNYAMMAICTYSLERCGATEILDVIANHEFALVKRLGRWETIGSARLKRAEEEIRDLARFPAENPNPVMRLSGDGTVLYANAPGQARLQEWGSAIGDAAPSFLRALAREAITKKSGARTDIQWDGRTWLFTTTPIIDSGYVNLYGIDVTERRMAEEALRRSEQDLNRAQAVAEIGSWRMDVRRNVLDWSEESYRMFGVPPETAMTYEAFMAAVHPEDREMVDTAWQVAQSGGAAYNIDHRIVINGVVKWVHEQADLEFDEKGELRGGFGTCQDITQRKEREDQLRLQATALQAAANGIVITDSKGIIQWVNEAFTHLTGYSAAEALGKNPRVLKSGKHGPDFYHVLWKTVLAGRVWGGEIVNKRKDGGLYTEEMMITPVLDDGAISHFIAIKQDVTERKRAQADLERTRNEFLGEIGHELKTPLTAIKGCASMALSARTLPDPAESRELFEIVDAQANRLAELVSNLLDVTRLEAGILSVEPGEAELAAIIDEARVIFEHSRYPHALRVKLPAGLPLVAADSRRIVQVLMNLFSNAAKCSPQNTPIVVSARYAGNEVTVQVRDRGVGISADKLPLLFQKFAQIQTKTAKGTGLGLFICKGIVEAHGGRIWAKSSGEGQGTTFSFTLPAQA